MTSFWQIEQTRSGFPTAIMGSKTLHSRFDPVREAQKTANEVPDNADTVILGGLGLGYVAEALLKANPNRRLIIAESNPEGFAEAFKVRNLSVLEESTQVSFFSARNPSDIAELLSGGPVGAGIHLLLWRPSRDLNQKWYGELEQTVKKVIHRKAVNARTLERFGSLWVRNLAANARHMAGALSLSDCIGAFQDIPALVIAGGPTLDEYLPLLPQLAESHLIIAVDTAVNAVLRQGVCPDVAAAVDPQYWNTRHLDRCAAQTQDALVLAEAATHPSVFRTLGGRPLLMRTRFPLGSVLEDAAGISGQLRAGGSVATAAWDLARYMGCSPITAVGLDLGFPGGRTHYNGSLSRERPHLFGTRTAPAQTAFFHALHDASPYPVSSTEGGMVLTDKRMDIYALWFAENVAAVQDRQPAVLGGLGRKIAGMGRQIPQNLLEKNKLRDKINAVRNSLLNRPSRPEAEAQVQQALLNLVERLEELAEIADRGRQIVSETEQILKEGGDPSKGLSALEDIDARILSGGAGDVVSFLIQPIILEMSGGGESVDPLENSKRLYGEIHRSAVYHSKYLRKAI